MATTAELITQLYVGYYNRAPDPEGLNYWIGRANAGVSMADIANSFAASPEAIATYPYLAFPNVANAETFLEQIYQNLFNRSIDADGRAYYANKLATGQTTPGQIIAEIQANANTNPNNTDGQVLANKVTVGLDFALEAASTPGFRYEGAAVDQANTVLDNVTDSQASVDAALASNDTFFDGVENIGDTFTLTTGVDAPGAAAPAEDTAGGTGNDTYNAFLVNDGTAVAAAGSTLQTSDLINAGAGTDTLAVTVTGGAGALAQALPVSSGLEKVSVRNVATGSVTLDATLAAGLTEVGNTASTAAVAFTNVGSNTTVRVADSSAGTTVTFADKVFQAGGTASISVKNAGTSTTDATIRLGTAATAGTATTLAIAAEGKNFINLAAGANNVAAANGIKTITVSGSGTVDLDATAALVATTLAADVTKLDASANTGGVTATVSNTKVAVTGGSGADVITVGGALVEGASINLGAGNDSLLQTGAGAIGSKVTVDGGAGVDAISTAFINAGNGSQFLNFERLDLAAGTLDASLLTGSTITDLVLSGAGGTTINNVKAGVDLIVSSTSAAGTTTINVADATKAGNTSDVFDINFAGAAVSGAAATAANVKAGTIALAGVETVNIASDGGANTWNSITLTDDAAKDVNISGSQNLDLAITAQNKVGAATDEALTTINGSTATGKLSITVNGNFDGSITGGSAADIITVSSQATTLTGGAGNDEFRVGAADVGAGGAATPVITTITDFTKGDKIDFGAATAFQTTKVNVGAATDLASALELAADVTTSDLTWFQFGNDTYIVADNTAGGTADAIDATDTVVKLVGLHDLSTSTLATNDLTFA